MTRLLPVQLIFQLQANLWNHSDTPIQCFTLWDVTISSLSEILTFLHFDIPDRRPSWDDPAPSADGSEMSNRDERFGGDMFNAEFVGDECLSSMTGVFSRDLSRTPPWDDDLGVDISGRWSSSDNRLALGDRGSPETNLEGVVTCKTIHVSEVIELLFQEEFRMHKQKILVFLLCKAFITSLTSFLSPNMCHSARTWCSICST